MNFSLKQLYTINTPVTRLLYDPMSKSIGDDCGIFSITFLCVLSKVHTLPLLVNSLVSLICKSTVS